MADTVGHSSPGSDHGHTGSVDAQLARIHGGRESTWHSRRFGPHAVNQLAACIIREWREAGDLAELGGVGPIHRGGVGSPDTTRRVCTAPSGAGGRG
jgi:hypothetical protein